MRVLVEANNNKIYKEKEGDKIVYSFGNSLNEISFDRIYICRYYNESLEVSKKGDLIKIGNVYGLEGLEINKKVKKLDLGWNEIVEIENLDNLKKLKVLYLSNNDISMIENIEGLKNLKELYLRGNLIECITESAYEFIEENDVYVDMDVYIDSLVII